VSDQQTAAEEGPFDRKNADRKVCRVAVGVHRYNEARRLRRRYTVNGAFGAAPASKLWNEMVVGTTGSPRSRKDDDR
jgi:hypothetical protein